MSVDVKISLDFEQVKNIVDQLTAEEQNKLTQYLDKKTLYKHWDKLQEELKEIPLTPEEIQKEVEAVRAKR